MQHMKLEYAQELLEGKYTFGNKMLSCYDDLLVVEYDESGYHDNRTSYYGTQLKNGKLQVDDNGFVVFKRVKPVIDENTKFQF